MSPTKNLLLAALVAALVGAGCGAPEPGQADVSSPDPLEFLAERPALPATYMRGAGSESIDWSLEPGDGRVDLRTCGDGAGAFRSWSEDGVEWAMPSVAHAVCVFATEEAARSSYASQSLLDVGGEDWPNFEPGSDAETVPSDVNSLDVLAADEWEIGCGIGEPDSGCAVWTFRARYGRVLTEIEFTASPGAIRFEQMRELVQSVDAAVADASGKDE